MATPGASVVTRERQWQGDEAAAAGGTRIRQGGHPQMRRSPLPTASQERQSDKCSGTPHLPGQPPAWPTGAAPTPTSSRNRRPPWLILSAVVPAGLSLAVSSSILVAMLTGPEAARGVDFHVFYAAGWAVRHGLDPYRASALAHAWIQSAPINSGQPLGAFPYLPWVGWAMAPWSLLPYPASLVLWQMVSATLVLASSGVWARSLGWYRAWALGILASVSTVAFLGYQVGQFDAVGLALVVGTSLAAGRGRWLLAGLASAAVVLLKPQVTLPLVPLLWVLVVRERAPLRSVLTGQAVALAILLGLPMFLQPRRTGAWMHLVLGFSHSIGQGQFTPVGLSGLIHLAPSSWHLGTGLTSPTTIGLVTAGLAAMVPVAWAPMRGRNGGCSRTTRAGWGLLLPLGIWMLVTPYVHTYDILILLPLFFLTLGPGGVELRRPLPWVIMGSLLLLPVVYLHIPESTRTAGPLSSLAVLALVLFAVGRRSRRQAVEVRQLAVSQPTGRGCEPNAERGGGKYGWR